MHHNAIGPPIFDPYVWRKLLATSLANGYQLFVYITLGVSVFMTLFIS